MSTKKLIHPKGTLYAHVFADIFPMMSDAEAREHAADIKENGQKTAIVLTKGDDGVDVIADGRNTYFACIEAGIEPKFRQFGSDPLDGADLLAFVKARNLTRRNLTPSQKAAAAAGWMGHFKAAAAARMQATQFGAEGAPVPEKDKGTAAEKAAAMFGASPTATKLAAKLKASHPDLYDAVAKGEKTVHAADMEMRERDEKAAKAANAQAERMERIKIITALEKRYGADTPLLDSIRGQALLKKHGDLVAFADLQKEKALKIVPVLRLGGSWSVAKTLEFAKASLSQTATASDLINKALLEHEGENADLDAIKFVVEINGYTFTVTRPKQKPAPVEKKDETPATPPKPAPAAKKAATPPKPAPAAKKAATPKPAPAAK